MADDIIARCSKLKITEDEETIVTIDDDMDETRASNISLSIVGRVLSKRPYNFEAFKRTMNQIWMISKHALFRAIGNGFFIIQFVSQRDREKVLDGRPWTFDQSLVLLDEIKAGVQPSDIVLNHSPFWLRLYNLPLESRSAKHVRSFAQNLGEVLDIDHDGVEWDKTARVKVSMDVTRPLRRVLRFRNRQGQIAMVEIKYERLPTFCYVCGILAHIERDCAEATEEERSMEHQWGSWLRASPRRGRLKMQEETKAFLSCCRALQFESPMKKDASAAMQGEEGVAGSIGKSLMKGNVHGGSTVAGEMDVWGVDVAGEGVQGRMDNVGQEGDARWTSHQLGDCANHDAVPVGDMTNHSPVMSPPINEESNFPPQSGTLASEVFNSDFPSSQVSTLFNIGVGNVVGTESRKLKKGRNIKRVVPKNQNSMEIDGFSTKKRKQEEMVSHMAMDEMVGEGKCTKLEEADVVGSVKVAEVGCIQPREEP